ncbi:MULTISPECIES: DASS family sodium-coupled anion symporter [Micrococcaceae]|uniref:SLC13 family permease n=1 Tax=Micrococcaceae TaxID=1268 RepID=UPI001614B9A5|nr:MULTISPECIES: SLC13 family permease [Micrococcaceae]MBB5750695.1 sodium-dependent dicarboxylate transporter 2/3/5 [Micrococcus sp. TA1]HRO28974.1 SLC13 family permease [Citricoccus sp.]HRO92914.1 SLC13 family permease [Citricoccus sp.]
MTTSPTDARDLRPSEAPGSPAAAEATEQRDALDSGAKRNWWLLALGPVAGLVLALVLPASLSFEGRAVAGCALWMAIWWMTEAAPIPVTSLLPLVLFPLFGMASMKEVAAPYADSVVFLVMGGVILGLATEKSNLHLRVALLTIRAVGTKPAQIVFGLMAASAFISAWVSNTATAVIMVPIAVSILQLVRSVDREAAGTKFAASMLLGVAYGVTIGSTATLIGQPPMALMKAYLGEAHGFDLQFGHWMLVGVPWALVMLFIAWLVLTKIVFRAEVQEIPGGKEMIRRELAALGTMTTPERRVGIIFLLAIFFWVAVPFIAGIPAVAETLPFLGSISDTQVAMAAAIACFLVPAQRRSVDPGGTALLRWSAAKEIPWGLLLLFGGGLSLSAMFTATGFSDWLGGQVSGLTGVPPWLVMLVVIIVSLALTELTSNTATAAAFFPIFGAVAVGLGMDPLFMTIAVTLAVCSAYMLPVATPSNAVAFGSGEVSIKQMVRAGVWLNVISLALIMVVMYTLVPLVFPDGM